MSEAVVNKAGNKKGTIAVSLTNYLDAGAIVAGASGLTLWAEELNLSSLAVGILGAVSANAFGAAIGALLGGRLADKYGRKFIYTYNMLIYMLGVALIMFSMNFTMLLAGFLVTGISVGIGVPAAWTYISETSDAGNRARNIGISQFAWSIGPAIIFLLGVILSPLGLMGNRIIFGTLFVVAFIAWQMQRKLDESEAWQASQAEEKITKKAHPYKELFTNKINIKSLLFLVGVYMFWNLVAGAMGFFMPFVYETVGGLTNTQANLLQTVLWTTTAVSTYFVFSKYADKISQRTLFTIGAALGVIAWIVLTFAGMTWLALWIFVIAWGFQAGIGAQAFYALWSSELFPARYRGAAQGLMYFVVRSSVGIWSMIFPLMLSSLGFKAAGVFMIIMLVISLIIGVIWTPNTQGKSLAAITKERYGSTEK
ncbi:MFS transporter [Brochothrix campestris]|uniref:Minor myo-inositol transporter iolF n=1 Tax=Brochothrix campestris FSL F6-1037 TaxID=1265861 RepID=W7CGB2_9LIST|nr:MFS transporter [Brochothrix campestris]EUJ35967.1 Minor myo-inositol transporter iolF [Brochothrix campestris FSL F6-1037]